MPIPRTKDVVKFDDDGIAILREILDQVRRLAVNVNGDVMKGPLGFKNYTNANRPAATSVLAGATIWNTDDGQLNISDATDWTLPDGTTT